MNPVKTNRTENINILTLNFLLLFRPVFINIIHSLKLEEHVALSLSICIDPDKQIN